MYTAPSCGSRCSFGVHDVSLSYQLDRRGMQTMRAVLGTRSSRESKCRHSPHNPALLREKPQGTSTEHAPSILAIGMGGTKQNREGVARWAQRTSITEMMSEIWVETGRIRTRSVNIMQSTMSDTHDVFGTAA